jgi:hypothetical protein
MEAASEKPRRGRPPSIPPDFLAGLRKELPYLTTRQLHEHVYAFLALRQLEGESAFAWLLEPQPRVSLLAELGRLGVEDADVAREAAAVLCEKKLSTTRSRALVRRLRLGQDATADGFARALADAADAYMRRHGRPSREAVLLALGRLYDALVKDEEGEG